jgi:arylsulfatase A-like enzyme
MSYKNIFKTFILFLGGIWASSVGFISTTYAQDKPNVIVILVDDMGWSDISSYGGEVPTPNLDKLAANGIRYSQFYNTGRCSPTRASLLTGHYPHQAGMGHLDGYVRKGTKGFQGKISENSVTMAEVLKEEGYFTALSGKWHLGQDKGCTPWDRGFMRSMNLARGGVYFPDQGGKRGQSKLYLNGQEKELDDPLFGDDWYGTYLWNDWGLKFIDEAIEEDKPFFLYLAHCTPHFPLMAPEKVIEKYRGKYMKGWDALRQERYERQVSMGLIDESWDISPRPDDTPAWESLSQAEKERYDHMMAIYAAMIETMDQSIGELVEGLEQRGELDNTLILFLSDNGGNAESGVEGRYVGEDPGGPKSNVFIGQCWAMLNNTPFRKYKHYVHEGGVSTPLIAHWPKGIDKKLNGSIDHQPGHLIDIMTTLVDLSGADFPEQYNGHSIEPMEGISLKPSFKGKDLKRGQPIFFQHEANRGVRAGNWKLVALRNGPWELYNIEKDRTELNDLSKQYPEIVKELSEKHDAWAERTHADLWQSRRKRQ